MPIALYSDDMEHEFEVNDIVSPATEQDARILQSSFNQRIDIHTKFKVCVVVESAKTYRGKNQSGLIVSYVGRGRFSATNHRESFGYPYVWDAKRFVKVD